jgi:hypothetical protein
MYADDTVIFSENVEDLQNLINSVNVIANDHGLYVNLNKTKIVVFRSRSNVKPEDAFSLSRVGMSVSIYKKYRYQTKSKTLVFHD